MLKWFKRLVFLTSCVALLGGAVYGGGFLLPAKAHLERTLSVDAEAEHVFAIFNSLEGLTSFWVKSGQRSFPDFAAQHSGGPAEGEGLAMSFTGGGRAMGTQTIREAVLNKRVVYDVDYGLVPLINTPLTLTRTIELVGVGPITTITWTEDATLDQPLLRYFALLSENSVEAEIGAALDDVKVAAEAKAVATRASAAEQAAASKAAAAAEAELEQARRLAEKQQADDEWEYTQEEAPTPIEITPPPEAGAKK